MANIRAGPCNPYNLQSAVGLLCLVRGPPINTGSEGGFLKTLTLAILAISAVFAVQGFAQEAPAPGYNCSGLVLDGGKMQTVSVAAGDGAVQLTIADQAPVAYPIKQSQTGFDSQTIIAQKDESSLFGDLNKYVLVIHGDTAKLITARIGRSLITFRDHATVRQYDLTCAI